MNKAAGETYKDELQDNEHGLIKDMADRQAPDAQIQNIVFQQKW